MPLPSITAMLAELVALPSISCTDPQLDMGNRAVIDKLAEWAGSLGFDCEIMEVSTGKANLIATLGTGTGGLVLAGHTDTVPFDESRWKSDPFRLTERDQRLYGLGSADMKGFFPLALQAASAFTTASLTQPLILLATCDEECSMSGALALVKAGRPKARHAVIGEPTGLKPIRMHKGILMESLVIEGRSGHSSDPSLGASALEAMHGAIGELLDYRNELQQRYHNPAFSVPVPTINLGCIHGGDNPNRICPRCELQFDLRPLPGMEADELRGEIRRRLKSVAERHDVTIQVEPLFPGTPAVETPATAAIVAAAERLTGQTAGAVAFGTEAPFLTQLGIETIVLGPGDIDQAHQPDEFIRLDRIQPTVDILESLIRQFCLSQTPGTP